MIGTAAILMLATGRIPILAALVILARDVALVLGYRLLSPGGYDLEVTRSSGRLATWVLYASLGFVLVTAEGTTWPIVLLWIGVALSLGAGVQYGAAARGGRCTRAEGTLESSTNLRGLKSQPEVDPSDALLLYSGTPSRKGRRWNHFPISRP